MDTNKIIAFGMTATNRVHLLFEDADEVVYNTYEFSNKPAAAKYIMDLLNGEAELYDGEWLTRSELQDYLNNI